MHRLVVLLLLLLHLLHLLHLLWTQPLHVSRLHSRHSVTSLRECGGAPIHHHLLLQGELGIVLHYEEQMVVSKGLNSSNCSRGYIDICDKETYDCAA